jgi:predicted MPP superfamily phosphohydrolase
MPASKADPRSARAAALRLGVALASGIIAYAFLVKWVLRPLHQHEVWQPFLATVLGLEEVLLFPGRIAAQFMGLHLHHHATLRSWVFSLGINGTLYFLAGLAWATFRRRSPRPFESKNTSACENPQKELPHVADTPGHLSRRRFLTGGTRMLGLGAAAGVGYSLVVEPRWFTISRHDVRIQDLPRELDGLRLVQLTDIHHGPWLSLHYVREVVKATNDEAPDLVCLTGDYVFDSPVYIEPVIAELANLQPRIATLAVLGNHDWWENVARVRRGLATANIPLIDNDRRVLTPDRRLVLQAKSGLAICGVGDFWEDCNLDFSKALDGLPARMPRLLLSHNPDVAEEPELKEAGRRVDLMLSGHTHGGQVRLPLLGAPITNSAYGQKYARGLVQGPACPVYICRGIGVSGCPLRLGSFPEIALFQLHSA